DKQAGISGRDYNAMAVNAIPDINAAAAKIDNVFGTFIDKATNFSKNVIGRHHEQYDLNKAIGGISAHTEHMTPGSFHHGVNTKLLEDKTKELADLRATVRTDRTNAALVGVVGTGAVMTINDEMQRRKQYKYASVVPGTESSHTTYQLSTERGNIAGDALHAIETVNQEPSYTKKKFLAAAAVAAISAGGLMYGAKQISNHPELMHMTTASGRAGMELGKSVAEVLPYVTGVGGAYYAYQNRDNPTKRNIGLGVTGLSAAARYAMPNLLDISGAPDVAGRARAIATASSAGFLGSVGYAAHKGQEIANHEAIENAMHSEAPIEDVTHTVNTIRGRHTLATKYPVTRYMALPSAVTRLFNSKMGVPAGAMNDGDKAYYHEAQVDAEFERLKKRYEANMGRLNHAGHTDLREIAIDTVSQRLNHGTTKTAMIDKIRQFLSGAPINPVPDGDASSIQQQMLRQQQVNALQTQMLNHQNEMIHQQAHHNAMAQHHVAMHHMF
ncbi:MAG: hypothetical protein PHY48_15255, partial [Candidatus Cloacimonetes bacterium]|nr:hypothetical protein [Candidatus Cloacimonadota bacterium]